MTEENITSVARNLISSDRLSDILSLSDKENAYCLPASFVQLTTTLNESYLPPRLKQFKTNVVQNHLNLPDGKVPPEKLIEVINKITQYLDIRVVRVIGRADFFHKAASPSDVPKTHLLKTHAECCDGTNLSNRRIKELSEAGWFNLAAVVCQPGNNNQTPDGISDTIEHQTGFIPLEEPYVLLLGKLVEKN
ncbi:hypothetical protein A2Z67_01825 [Candidatus Woesebacteria bacterium RBG_13_36_22]|uniref:Uncharacterized protein n=1 Tax=Candidatus Woesebacteria bacterium RBG_13_36_22 TaxID=1802478 RepID=A0A1F7X314_9BACT|nr:MAG: hypothetical protein A2Z67_01825 [Candidatus Woesebacteria bacterium RBG_13_36_22]